MTQYCIQATEWGAHMIYNREKVYQIPHANAFYTAVSLNDCYWFEKKPTQGSSANAAFRRAAHLQLSHGECGCKFEVIEI